MSKVDITENIQKDIAMKNAYLKIRGHCTHAQESGGCIKRYKEFQCKYLTETDNLRCNADKKKRECVDLMEYETRVTKILKRKKVTLLPCQYYEDGKKILDYEYGLASCTVFKDYMEESGNE